MSIKRLKNEIYILIQQLTLLLKSYTTAPNTKSRQLNDIRMFSGQNVHLNTSSNLIIKSAGNSTRAVRNHSSVGNNSHSSDRKHKR